MTIPSVKQVREHDKVGGLWRETHPHMAVPHFYRLTVDLDIVVWDPDPATVAAQPMIPAHHLGSTWTPCTSEGDPLPLLSERDEVKFKESELRQRIGDQFAEFHDLTEKYQKLKIERDQLSQNLRQLEDRYNALERSWKRRGKSSGKWYRAWKQTGMRWKWWRGSGASALPGIGAGLL